jgi:hypothetical protein
MVALSIVEINAVTHRGRVRAYRDITAARAGQRANARSSARGLEALVMRFHRRQHRANTNGADFWSTPWPNQTGG